VLDAYALWTINPALRVRLSANNLLAQDAVSDSTTTMDNGYENAQSQSPTYVSWRVQLEMKL
jgi:outer membrane receptor for ferrienterochelin and colicins